MKTSVLIPVRGRRPLYKRLISSIKNTAVGEIEFLVGADVDDPTDFKPLPCIRYTDMGSSQKACELAKMAHGDVILMGSTDEVFLTEGWDKILYDSFPADRLAVLYTRDDPGEHRGSCRPVISREWYELAGFYPPYFRHFHADKWVTDIADDIGRLIFVADVVIDHRHPKHGKGPWDEIYDRRGPADYPTWNNLAPERKKLSEIVKHEIDVRAKSRAIRDFDQSRAGVDQAAPHSCSGTA